jgi:quinoprotein glucose dehydrogenase
MTRPTSHAALPLFALAVAGFLLAPRGEAQTANGEWPSYGGDLAHTRYAPLDQIDASNFGSLTVAWRFSTVNLGPTPEYRFQSTPVVVDGVLYTTGGTRRAVTALDAETGEQLWVYSLNEGERGANAARRLSGRGLAFWQRGRDKRVVYVTPGYQLVALNADTGRPVQSFGKGGVVDLMESLDQGSDWDRRQIGLHSPPTIANGVVIVGAAHTPLAPASQAKNVIGYIRGFDVVTGKLLWTFHTIPRRGEPGYETWLDGAAEKGGGNAGVWAATCTAACAPARICTARASSRSTRARACAAGTSRRRIIRCGTTTCRRRRSSSTR